MLRRYLPEFLYEDENTRKFLSALEEFLISQANLIEWAISRVDIDQTDAKFLRFLAELTNAPLFLNNPDLWRQMLKDWVAVLKWKGTEKGIRMFADGLGLNVLRILKYQIYKIEVEGELLQNLQNFKLSREWAEVFRKSLDYILPAPAIFMRLYLKLNGYPIDRILVEDEWRYAWILIDPIHLDALEQLEGNLNGTAFEILEGGGDEILEGGSEFLEGNLQGSGVEILEKEPVVFF